MIISLFLLFRDNPTFLACMLCSVMSIMKSYPALGDAAVPFALLALWMHIFPCKKKAINTDFNLSELVMLFTTISELLYLLL